MVWARKRLGGTGWYRRNTVCVLLLLYNYVCATKMEKIDLLLLYSQLSGDFWNLGIAMVFNYFHSDPTQTELRCE